MQIQRLSAGEPGVGGGAGAYSGFDYGWGWDLFMQYKVGK